MANEKPVLNEKKAEILGLLCAEGSHYKYISKYTVPSRNWRKDVYAFRSVIKPPFKV